jgi:Domain of unknown function (DUF4177)
MAYEYKCVSGPTIVAVKNAKVRDQAVKAFEDIMNAQAADGWEYVGIDEFHVSEPEGLFSRKRIYVPAKILVFRRAKSGSMSGSVLGEALRANSMKAAVPDQPSVPDPAQPAIAIPADNIRPSLKAIVAKVTAEKS